MLKWTDFESQFDESWHQWVKPIIESEKFAKAFNKLRIDGKTKTIIPSSKSGNLFRIFREVKYNDMVAVVVGLSPYNVIINGVEVADGIALSCSNTMKEQPSLTQWYNAMEKEFGKDIIRNPDLSYLTKQGIFMYNYSLSCPKGEANGHLDVWEYFTRKLFEGAISEAEVPVISLGKEAEKVGQWITPWQVHYSLKHPASAAYSKTDWDSEGVFYSVEKQLLNRGVHISWVQRKDKF